MKTTIILLAVLCWGCSKPAPPSPPPAPPVQVAATTIEQPPAPIPPPSPVVEAPPDPLKMFRAIMSKVQDGREDSNCFARASKNLRYDLRKTDSLVSPYMAIVECDKTFISLQARGDDGVYGSGLHVDVPINITFAFQDGKWTLQDVHNYYNTDKFYSEDMGRLAVAEICEKDRWRDASN